MNTIIAYEAPLKSLELSSKFGDYLFAIAVWLKHEEYSDFIMNRNEHVGLYLDNGCYEKGSSINILEYIEIIEALRPDVIVAPDVYLNMQETLRMTKAFFDKKRPHAKYMIVPQGRDTEEWIRCFHTMVRMFRHEFQVIGIPRNMYPKRLSLIRHVYNFAKKDIHLLGCVEPSEIAGILSSNIPILSMDTSWPGRFALGRTGPEDRIDFESDEISFESFDNAVKEFIKRITPTPR